MDSDDEEPNRISLKNIDFTNNNLGSVIVLDALVNLEKINFSINNITGLKNNLFEKLTNLKEINFYNNQMKNMPNLNSLKKLEILNFSHNSLTILPNLDSLVNLITFN